MEEQDVLPPKAQTHYNNVRFSLFAGAVAGIAAKTCIAPAERIKMSFQVSTEKFSWRKALERGRLMVIREGLWSLWKGHSTTLLRVAPYAGISYMAHDIAENSFKQLHGSNSVPAVYKFLAGSFGGVCGTVMTYPLDVLRVRLALGGNWRGSVAQGGWLQGLTPTLLGIVPYAGTAWLTKQTLSEIYLARTHQPPPLSLSVSLVVNMMAGLLGQLVTYPLDVVRRRMQVASAPAPSFLWVVRDLVVKEGMGGLAKGFTMNLVKGPISLSISLTVFDLLKRFDSPRH